jgi:haloacetate dehalogenase
MFGGFDSREANVGETTIFFRSRGSGRPLLLLHGFPETHLMWHRIAPALASEFTVVCADLRGYGASGKPVSTAEHTPYSKSALALDMVHLMEALGFVRFFVAGHDRGARVAYRMALDHPDRVERLALLDILPTSEVFGRTDSRLMLSFWPFSLLAQPEPLPERLMLAAPESIVDDALNNWGSDPASFSVEVRAAYIEALRDPQSVHAICEEYRAAATIDVARDLQDRNAGHRIACPVCVLWSEGGGLDTWYAEAGGPLAIWRAWTNNVNGHAITGGHFFPESNPDETLAELRAFFRPLDYPHQPRL